MYFIYYVSVYYQYNNKIIFLKCHEYWYMNNVYFESRPLSILSDVISIFERRDKSFYKNIQISEKKGSHIA